MCLAQGPQRSDAGEARTRYPSVSSQALYHWATQTIFVMRGSRQLYQRGSSYRYDNFFCCCFCFLFVVGEEEKESNATNADQRNAIKCVSLAGGWWPNIKCWLCSFVIFQGIETSIVKKPFLWFFSGAGPLSPSLYPRMFVGYGQLNRHVWTSYLNIKHLGAGHIYIRSD